MRQPPPLPALFTSAALLFLVSAPRPALSQFKPSHSDEDVNAIGRRDPSISKGVNCYSLAEEKVLGEQLAKEVERSSKLIDDPVVTEYLNRVAQVIAKNSDAKFAVTIRVIDSDMIDAITLPGGFQYANKGLILATETEAELASVLAYGIAHTAMRSSTALLTKSELTSLASIPAAISIPDNWVRQASLALYSGMDLAIPLTNLKYKRDSKRAADFYGVQYLYKAGYSAESYPRFLERVWPQAAKDQNVPHVFSSFPPLPERLKAIRAEIARLLPARPGETVSSPDFEAVKEHLRAWQLKESSPGTNPEKPTLRKRAELPVSHSPPTSALP